jgi:UDP-N-acetylmuramoyl-L-alanyl-D-glutamate--2,6-diaminopimelate ligase
LRLDKLLTYRCCVSGDRDREITGLTHDSREVRDGFLFVAVRGGKSDGHDYIETAIARGAAAVVCEKGHPRFRQLSPAYRSVTWLEVEDCRDALAAFSSIFYGDPASKLNVIGITGTNGKTSVSYILKSILEKWGRRVGLVGTIRYMIADEVFAAPHTTPEASDFHSFLGRMVEKGCDYAVTEVSSHALAQKRTDYTGFKVAIFTNLTGDHLDYHGNIRNYFDIKTRLFTDLLSEDGFAVVNIDDPFGLELCDMLAAARPSVGLLRVSLGSSAAELRAEDIKYSFRGTTFILRRRGVRQGVKISSPLIGETGVYNVLSAMAAASALGVPQEAICEGVAAVGYVKGRFERVDCGQPFLAVVDYAHTHDALQRLLQTARRLLASQSQAGKGAGVAPKIITVFGCGGNRDKQKRPVMGKIATDLSDFVIVTSDNPRNEDPMAIIRDIEAGIGRDNYIIIQDRAIAIRMATLLASAGDIVMIAGKGHEDYQEVAGTRHPFSDRQSLEDAIRDLSQVTKRARAGKVLFGSAQC